MNYQTLVNKFNHALAWNGVLFFFHRSSRLFLTFIVYSLLSTQEFATWANVFSFVFLFALWFDFGLRRALPRYCPEFAKNKKVRNRFLAKLLTIYVGIILCVNIALVLHFPYLSTLVRLPTSEKYFYLGCMLFFLETIKSVIRLIFTAHFWHKKYNLLESLITVGATLVMIAITYRTPSGTYLLSFIFYTNIVARIVMILGGALLFRALNRDPDYQKDIPIDEKKITNEFLTHSGAMWVLIAVNSLTERNVLVPFFSATIGLEAANIFKLVNDSALFFQRFIVTVIGNTGITFLSHIETTYVKKEGEGKQTALQQSLAYFNSRLFFLVGAAVALTISVFVYRWIYPGAFFGTNYHSLFFVLTIFYLIHLCMMGYSQLLSVQRRYKALFLSLIPYLGLIGVVIVRPQSLLTNLVIIHMIRISSFALRMWFVKRETHVTQ